MPDFGEVITQEFFAFIKIIAAIFALVHLLIALILFQQIGAVNRLVSAPHGRTITFLGLVHLLLLAGILLLIVFY